MSERLLIVGAGPLGREVLCWALQIPAGQRTWEVGGFLDDQPGILDGFALPANLLGAPATHVFEPRDRVVVAIGDPAQRRSMVELLRSCRNQLCCCWRRMFAMPADYKCRCSSQLRSTMLCYLYRYSWCQ